MNLSNEELRNNLERELGSLCICGSCDLDEEYEEIYNCGFGIHFRNYKTDNGAEIYFRNYRIENGIETDTTEEQLEHVTDSNNVIVSDNCNPTDYIVLISFGKFVCFIAIGFVYCILMFLMKLKTSIFEFIVRKLYIIPTHLY
jgi:hypothetical protein